MALSWNKLSDRCVLFNNNKPRALYVELLKEAEKELVRKCDILEEKYNISSSTNDNSFSDFSLSGNQNSVVLPPEYKRMISVVYKGKHLKPFKQNDLYHQSDNSLSSGTPTHYYIQNNTLYFNVIPSDRETLSLYFYKNLISDTHSKILKTQKIQVTGIGADATYIVLNSNLKHELNGMLATTRLRHITTGLYTNKDITNLTYWKDMANPDSSQVNAWYKSTMTDSDYIGSLNNADLMINDYHYVAPIIPDQYHLDLCDYALAIASDDPNMHDKHMTMWLNKVEEIKNEDADRDLIHEVKADYYV